MQSKFTSSLALPVLRPGSSSLMPSMLWQLSLATTPVPVDVVQGQGKVSVISSHLGTH